MRGQWLALCIPRVRVRAIVLFVNNLYRNFENVLWTRARLRLRHVDIGVTNSRPCKKRKDGAPPGLDWGSEIKSLGQSPSVERQGGPPALFSSNKTWQAGPATDSQLQIEGQVWN